MWVLFPLINAAQTKKLKEMDLLHMGRAELSTDADKALEKLGKDQDNRHGRAGDVAQESSAQQRAAEEDPGFIVTFIQASAGLVFVFFLHVLAHVCPRETLGPAITIVSNMCI